MTKSLNTLKPTQKSHLGPLILFEMLWCIVTMILALNHHQNPKRAVGPAINVSSVDLYMLLEALYFLMVVFLNQGFLLHANLLESYTL